MLKPTQQGDVDNHGSVYLKLSYILTNNAILVLINGNESFACISIGKVALKMLCPRSLIRQSQ